MGSVVVLGYMAISKPSAPLINRSAVVWLSRPGRRAHRLAQQIETAGIRALICPAMRIADSDEPAAMEQYLSEAAHFAVSIFVSAEAAARIAARLPAEGAPLPALAIGAETAASLSPRYQLLTAATATAINDSRSLLADAPLQKPLGNIAVLGGSGDDGTPPSPLLLQALRARGNSVTAVSCYQRLPATADRNLNEQGNTGHIQAAVAYSSDSLRYMVAMTAPDNDWLRALPLFVIHPNIAATARQLGFQEVITANDSTSNNGSLVRQLQQRLLVR